jgi:hypothetical protein
MQNLGLNGFVEEEQDLIPAKPLKTACSLRIRRDLAKARC